MRERERKKERGCLPLGQAERGGGGKLGTSVEGKATSERLGAGILYD